MRTLSLRTALAALALTFALAGCSGARLQANEGAAQNQKSCASCKRMCEVAGDARANADGVAKCKADCDQKCQ